MAEQTHVLKELRTRIKEYHQSMRWDSTTCQHRDPFINWYKRSTAVNHGDPKFRILVILINARFDQGTRAERALENTQRLVDAGILDYDQVQLDDVPVLNTRQRMNAERWRELLWRSLPGLRQLSYRIADRRRWKASELLQTIVTARVPFFGPKTARLAVRWVSELISEIEVNMADSEVPVDSLVYRVAARLGVLNPERDRYWGPGSPGHQKIQAAARELFPDNPSLMDEPIWMMGRERRNGGFCSPTQPGCDSGCLFASFCPRLFQKEDPGSIGYSAQQPKPKPERGPVYCRTGISQRHGLAVPITFTRTAEATAIAGLLVVVSCVKNKVWDVDPSAPPQSLAGTAYVGSFFAKNRLYALTFGEAWCVLSAKFGFVLPTDEIENYNLTFKYKSSELITVPQLKKQIVARGLNRFARVQVLGGSEYVSRVLAAFEGSGLTVESPLAGLRIGQSMRAVQYAVDSQSAL